MIDDGTHGQRCRCVNCFAAVEEERDAAIERADKAEHHLRRLDEAMRVRKVYDQWPALEMLMGVITAASTEVGAVAGKDECRAILHRRIDRDHRYMQERDDALNARNRMEDERDASQARAEKMEAERARLLALDRESRRAMTREGLVLLANYLTDDFKAAKAENERLREALGKIDYQLTDQQTGDLFAPPDLLECDHAEELIGMFGDTVRNALQDKIKTTVKHNEVELAPIVSDEKVRETIKKLNIDKADVDASLGVGATTRSEVDDV